jgi:hypothetical protein
MKEATMKRLLFYFGVGQIVLILLLSAARADDFAMTHQYRHRYFYEPRALPQIISIPERPGALTKALRDIRECRPVVLHGDDYVVVHPASECDTRPGRMIK